MMYLFNLGHEYIKYLKESKINEKLINIFKAHNIELSDNAKVIKEDEPLFSLTLDHEEHPTEGPIADELREEFLKKGCILDRNVQLSKQDGKFILMEDEEEKYIIKVTAQKLNIYEKAKVFKVKDNNAIAMYWIVFDGGELKVFKEQKRKEEKTKREKRPVEIDLFKENRDWIKKEYRSRESKLRKLDPKLFKKLKND